MDETETSNMFDNLGSDPDVAEDETTWLTGTVVETSAGSKSYVVLYHPTKKLFFFSRLKGSRKGTDPRPGQSMWFTVPGDGSSPPEAHDYPMRDYSSHVLHQADEVQMMTQDDPIDMVPVVHGVVIGPRKDGGPNSVEIHLPTFRKNPFRKTKPKASIPGYILKKAKIACAFPKIDTRVRLKIVTDDAPKKWPKQYSFIKALEIDAEFVHQNKKFVLPPPLLEDLNRDKKCKVLLGAVDPNANALVLDELDIMSMFARYNKLEDVTAQVIMDTIALKHNIQLTLASQSSSSGSSFTDEDRATLRKRTHILEDIMEGSDSVNLLINFVFLTKTLGSKYQFFDEFSLHCWCNQLQAQLSSREFRFPGVKGIRLAGFTFLATTSSTFTHIHSYTPLLANTPGNNHLQNVILLEENFRTGAYDKFLDGLEYNKFIRPVKLFINCYEGMINPNKNRIRDNLEQPIQGFEVPTSNYSSQNLANELESASAQEEVRDILNPKRNELIVSWASEDSAEARDALRDTGMVHHATSWAPEGSDTAKARALTQPGEDLYGASIRASHQLNHAHKRGLLCATPSVLFFAPAYEEDAAQASFIVHPHRKSTIAVLLQQFFPGAFFAAAGNGSIVVGFPDLVRLDQIATKLKKENQRLFDQSLPPAFMAVEDTEGKHTVVFFVKPPALSNYSPSPAFSYREYEEQFRYFVIASDSLGVDNDVILKLALTACGENIPIPRISVIRSATEGFYAYKIMVQPPAYERAQLLFGKAFKTTMDNSTHHAVAKAYCPIEYPPALQTPLTSRPTAAIRLEPSKGPRTVSKSIQKILDACGGPALFNSSNQRKIKVTPSPPSSPTPSTANQPSYRTDDVNSDINNNNNNNNNNKKKN